MNDIYKNIEEYNLNKEHKILIVFDDMIADVLSNKKLNLLITELFIICRKLNISLGFITQFHLAVPKRYWAKFYGLFYYGNSKKSKTSTNCI